MMQHTSRLVAGLALAVLLASTPAAATRPTPERRPLPTCRGKPAAPLDIDVVEGARHGERFEIEIVTSARRPMDELTWTVRPFGLARVEAGTTEGSVAARPGRPRPAARWPLTLLVPDDDPASRIEIAVTGRFLGASDRGERAMETVTRVLVWPPREAGAPPGRRDGAGATGTETAGGATGTGTAAGVAIRAVPSRHVPAWMPAPGASRPPDGASRPGSAAVPGPAGTTTSFVVSGLARYVDKAWAWKGWTGEDPLLPVRRAAVVVLDEATGAVLGEAVTAGDGSFAVPCGAEGAVDLVVHIEADSRLDDGFQRMRVHDPDGATYAVLSPVFAGHPPVDLDAGTIVALPELVSNREGSSFNAFDVSVDAWEYLLGPEVGAGILSEPVEHRWPNASGTFGPATGALVGPDDGYDDAVLLHEIGHVVHARYGDIDGPGGTHVFGDSDQDPRLSLTEGYATFFTGVVLEHLGRRAIYVDSNALAQEGGAQLRLRHEDVMPYGGDAFGIADEVAVATALFDLLDDELSQDGTPGEDDDGLVAATTAGGLDMHRAFWAAWTGPVAEAFSSTQNDVWDALVALYGDDGALVAALDAAFAARGQNFHDDAAEPDGDPVTATWIEAAADAPWSESRTLYHAEGPAAAPGDGDADWFAHDLVAGSVARFVTRYPGGAADADTQADTVLEVFSPANAFMAIDMDGGKGRNARADVEVTETGTWRVRVTTQGGMRRYGTYEYRAKLLFENHAPVLATAPVASPAVLPDDEVAIVSVTAEDEDAGQALDFVWTAEEGTIEGGGPAVTYTPPVVSASREVVVTVRVEDELGASSVSQQVVLVVQPSSGGPCDGGALATDLGGGKPGALGTPDLDVVSLPVAGGPGLVLELSGAWPGLSGALVLGSSRGDAPFDQTVMVPEPEALLPLRAGGDGTARLAFTVPADGSVCGERVWAQAVLGGDPGAGGQGAVLSNAIELLPGS